MKRYILAGFLFFLLASCTATGGQTALTPAFASPSALTPSVDASPSAASVTPASPSPNPTIFRTVSVQACSVFQASTIRTLTSQGDLMAWSPAANTLAFLAPSDQMDQSIGSLVTVTIPAKSVSSPLALHAAGNLSWAPDGKHIAFAVLRLGEGLYSLSAVAADGSGLVDFFPGDTARTDEWSSPKIVRRWRDAQNLEIYSSCGLNCAASFTSDVRDGSRKPSGEPSSTKVDLWEIHRNTPAGETLENITKATSPNWSPEKNRIVYFDNMQNVWVVSKTDKNQFMLDLGKWSTPYETKWSADGNYLAIRTDISLTVFQMGCTPKS